MSRGRGGKPTVWRPSESLGRMSAPLEPPSLKTKILEPNPHGHRLYYVRILAEALPCGSVEWLTTPEAAKSQEAQVHLSHLLDARSLHCVQMESWHQRRKVLRTLGHGEHLVVIPDGDKWLPTLLWQSLLTLGRPHHAKYRVLCMRPPVRGSGARNAAATLRTLAKWLLIRAIARLNARSRGVELFSLVDSFGFTADWAPAGALPVADPVMPRDLPTREQARRRLGIDEDVLVVGLLGVIDQRKNPDIVLAGCVEAFRHMKGLLLVAGQVRAQGFPSDSARPGWGLHQLCLLDRYLSEDELGAAAAACDAVALLYDNHGSSSGVLSLAAQAGAAVIVPQGSRLARIAQVGGFGVGSSLSAPGIAGSLERVAAEREVLSRAALRASSRLGIADFVAKLTGSVREEALGQGVDHSVSSDGQKGGE